MDKDKSLDYFGKGGILKKEAAPELVNSAYKHDCADADILLKGISYADLAHTVMLTEENIIPREQGIRLLQALLEIHNANAGNFPIKPEFGDVYNSREAYLRNKIGDSSGWIHIGRPRREAVNIGYLIAVREHLLNLIKEHISLARIFLSKAEENVNTIMPDFTYLRHAHPTSLGHYMLTFVYPMTRDLDRLTESYKRVNMSPAGSGSVNGSRLAINRQRLAELLGFDSILVHTRDAMWQPDMPIEIMSNITSLLVNLDRFAEELQIWSTKEFNLIDLPDKFCRASVIMPQKKNPYSLAYIRGITGFMLGKTASFAAHGKTFSGNPDNRTFIYGELPRALDKTTGAIKLFAAVINEIRPNKELMLKRVQDGFSNSTDLSELIISETGLDYRTAHKIMGFTVRKAIEKGITGSKITKKLIEESITEITGKEINLREGFIDSALDPEKIVETRKGIGGASEKRTAEMIAQCRKKLSQFSKWLIEADTKHKNSLSNLIKIAIDIK
ncbi:argininosuccinate lyase [Candidatus Woesearchaeota archaeon]|nr:argininosuccinate lyase [Candidatus Woesearchaeota archaeon]